MAKQEMTVWEKFKYWYIDDWRSFIPETQNELVSTLFWAVVATTVFFLVLQLWKRPRASILPLLVATPIFFIFFANVLEPAYDYGKYIAVYVLTTIVQACFVIKVLRTPKIMYEKTPVFTD